MVIHQVVMGPEGNPKLADAPPYPRSLPSITAPTVPPGFPSRLQGPPALRPHPAQDPVVPDSGGNQVGKYTTRPWGGGKGGLARDSASLQV